MKKTLLAAALLTTGIAHAQITLEHLYAASSPSNNFTTTKFSNGEIKYVTVSAAAAPVVTVYNENHSVLKQMTAPAVANSYFSGIYLVSDKLFNQDAAIEYMAAYSVTSGSNTLYRLLVLNETGSQLLVADTATYYNVARVISGNTGIKLIIPTNRMNASGSSTGTYTKVYALGGTSIPTAAKAESFSNTALPYPNPAESRITLPYQVPAGQLSNLQVVDMTGRLVRQYKIDGGFQSLELNASELGIGTYTYRVVSATGAVTLGNKFTVH